MAGETGVLLLAVGVFDARPPLESAIAELHDEGFSARETCLMGTPRAFADMVKPPVRPLLPRSGRPLYQRQRHHLPWLSNDDDLRILATSGILLRTLVAQAAAEHDKSLPAAARLTQELSAKLNDHFEQGAMALLVSAADHTHQSQGTRVLLRHACDSVQTYAIRAAVGPRTVG